MTADDLGPGTQIDRYEIVRCVATGGMGRVWLARMSGKHGFEKLVAVKTLRPDLASNPALRAMLLDEARICARVHHAGVAQILDVGEHGEPPSLPYVVFEWVDGASLRDLFATAEVAGGRLPIGPLLRAMAGVCEALHAAHELTDDGGQRLQVVHRDVTPSNVIVGRAGYVKLIDFGIARARDRIAGETRSGIVKGTPEYMAPEQAQGAKVDRRADVWGVGAVLYRGIAGRPPFDQRTRLEAFIRGQAPLAPLPDDTAPDVRDIVMRAMQRDPAARFQTAADLGVALERAIGARPAGTAIVDLFADDAAPPPPSEIATALEQPALAPPAPPDARGANLEATLASGSDGNKWSRATSTGAAPAPSAAPVARGRPSRAMLAAVVVAFGAAAIAIGALVWALLSGP